MSPVRPLARLGVRGFCNAQRARPMRLFSYSITYISLLFGAMALDQLLRSGL